MSVTVNLRSTFLSTLSNAGGGQMNTCLPIGVTSNFFEIEVNTTGLPVTPPIVPVTFSFSLTGMAAGDGFSSILAHLTAEWITKYCDGPAYLWNGDEYTSMAELEKAIRLKLFGF